jgi:ribosomal protein L7/L12
MTNNDYDNAARIWAETNDYDSVVRHLRDKGYGKLDSIKAIREICGVTLGESKRKVELSEVWADTLDGSNQLHDAFFEGSTEKDGAKGT